jgi:hypothetical protein
MHSLKKIPWWFYVVLLKTTYIIVLATLYPEACISTDATGYLQLADNLWNNFTFSRSTTTPLLFDTLRTPGYPIFIILTGGLINPWFTVITQQLISAVGAIWLFNWLLELGTNKKPATLFAVLFALDIPSFIFSTYLLSDSLFQVLILGTCYFTAGKKNVGLSALLITLACFVKPAGLYFIPLWAIVILYQKSHRNTYLAIVFSLLGVGLWQLRNYHHHNRFIFSTAGEFNWCSWHGANIIAQQKNIPITQAQYVWWNSLAQQYPAIPEENQVAYSQFISKKSTQLIYQNLDLFTKQTIAGVGMLWLKPTRSHIDQQWGLTQKSKTNNWLGKLKATSWVGLVLMALQVITILFIYPLAIIGWISIFKKNKGLAIFIGLTLCYFSLMILPPTTYARLRLPLIPLQYFLAAIGFPIFIKALKNNRWLTQKV